LRDLGRAGGFGGRSEVGLRTSAVALLVLLLCFLLVPQAHGASKSSTPSLTSPLAATIRDGLSINPQQFEASVPSYAILGTNYTLKVLVQSTINMSVPVVVEVSTPVQAIFVHPQAIHMEIQPYSSQIANFTILPFGAPGGGPYNVTALLYVFFPLAMTSPALVNQTTVVVSTIGPNPFPYLEVVLISAVLVTLALVAVFYPGVFGKRFSGRELRDGLSFS